MSGGGKGGVGGNGASRNQGSAGGNGAGATNEYETGSLQTYAYGGAGAPGGPNRTYGGPALSGSNKGWGGNGGTNASGSSGHAGVVVLRWSV